MISLVVCSNARRIRSNLSIVIGKYGRKINSSSFCRTAWSEVEVERDSIGRAAEVGEIDVVGARLACHGGRQPEAIGDRNVIGEDHGVIRRSPLELRSVVAVRS